MIKLQSTTIRRKSTCCRLTITMNINSYDKPYNMNSNDTKMVCQCPCKYICYKNQTLYLIDELIDAY